MNTTQPTAPLKSAAARWTCLGNVCGRCGTSHRSYRSSEAHCQSINRRIRSALGGRNSYSDQSPTPLNEAAWRRLSAALARVHETGEDYEPGFDFGRLVDSMDVH